MRSAHARLKKSNASVLTGLEQLESRVMLAADLTGAWIGLASLSTITSGGTLPTVTLRAQNTGDSASTAGATVELYLSDDNALDPMTDLKIGSTTLASLKPATSKDLLFKGIKLSPGLDAGDRFLIARIDANNKSAEANEANNNIASDAPIAITQPDYDLTGVMAKPTLASQLVQGVANSGSVKLTLANSGTAKATASIGITFYLRPSANVDASGDIAIGSLAKQAIALAADKTKAFTGKLTLPTSVPVGDYVVVSVFDTLDSLAETNEANNTVVGSDVISIRAAFADLGITGGTVTAKANIPAGAKAVVSVNVFNAGNVAATGTVGVALVAKATGHPDVPLLSVSNIAFTAKAGFTKTVKVTFTVPLLLIDGVLYDVEVTLTPVTTAGGDVVPNNVAVFGSAFTPDIPVVLAPDIGDRVTFTGEFAGSGDSTTVTGPSHKKGNFVDGNGRRGTYDYRNNENAPFEVGTLILTWTDGLEPDTRTYYLMYGNEGGPHGLNGRTLKVSENIYSEVVGQIADSGLQILGYVAF